MAAPIVLQSCSLGESSGIAIGLGGGAVGAFLATLLSGAVLTTFIPRYTDGMIDAVRARPIGSLLYGLLSLLTTVLVSVLLFITYLGAPVAMVLLVVAIVAAVLGATIVFLAIADGLIGHDAGWLGPLLLAAGINGGLVLTGVGGLVTLGAAATGFGAMLNDYIG